MTLLDRIKSIGQSERQRMIANYSNIVRREAAGKGTDADALAMIDLLAALNLTEQHFAADVAALAKVTAHESKGDDIDKLREASKVAKAKAAEQTTKRAEAIRALELESTRIRNAAASAGIAFSAAQREAQAVADIKLRHRHLFGGDLGEPTASDRGVDLAQCVLVCTGQNPQAEYQPGSGPVVNVTRDEYEREYARRVAVVAEARAKQRAEYDRLVAEGVEGMVSIIEASYEDVLHNRVQVPTRKSLQPDPSSARTLEKNLLSQADRAFAKANRR